MQRFKSLLPQTRFSSRTLSSHPRSFSALPNYAQRNDEEEDSQNQVTFLILIFIIIIVFVMWFFYFDFDLKLMILLFGVRFWLKEERNRVQPFSTGQLLWTRLLLQWYGFFPFLLHLLRVLSYGALKQTQTPDTHWRWCYRGWV